MANIHKEEVENNDNFTAVNYDNLDIPQKCKEGNKLLMMYQLKYGKNLLVMKLTVMDLFIYLDFPL